jgi:hypothetical protein
MNNDSISFLEPFNVRPDLFNLSCHLMTEDRGRNVFSMHLLDVRTADSTRPHANQKFAVSDGRNWHVPKLNS